MSIKTLVLAGVATFGLCAGAQAQFQINSASQSATASATQTTGAQSQAATGSNSVTNSPYSRAGGQSATNLNAAANFLSQNNRIVTPPRVYGHK